MKRTALLFPVATIMITVVCEILTLAYLSSSHTVASSVIKTASFQVDSRGTLDEEKGFVFPKAYPSDSGEYIFTIDKTNAQGPVEYTITVTPEGELFKNGASIDMGLYRLNYPASPEDSPGKAGSRESCVKVASKQREAFICKLPSQGTIENFKLGWEWKMEDIDRKLQGLDGRIKVHVVAKQVLQ